MTVITLLKGRQRTRESDAPFSRIERLNLRQEALLKRWLASHAQTRGWQTLLERAGLDLLDCAEGLLDILVEAGAATARERLVRGTWQIEGLAWRDLSALQQAFGIATEEERHAVRSDIRQRLAVLASDYPWLQPAVASCLDSSWSADLLKARAELLHALAAWHAEQRFGKRRDFALYARQLTKEITHAEWKWLETHVALQALGIEKLAFILWLGGSLSLQTGRGRVDAGAAGFCGLPMSSLMGETRILGAPERYWLIENRTSFERQAIEAQPGTCVVWLPGRPPEDWLGALGWLLDHAPAPAHISCDPDPAGLDIALTAGALWAARKLEWLPYRMEATIWQNGPTTPHNAFDRAVLARLARRDDLPAPMAELRDALERQGRKAEQEAWL